MERILVIKLGALGDFVLATGALKAIRAHHKNAHITLLTTKGMMPFAKSNPNIDAIALDERKKPWHLDYMKTLTRQLKGFDLVYDLQMNDRTSYLYYFLAGRPDWCGIAPGCKYQQTKVNRRTLHSLDRMKNQLALAGIDDMPGPDLSYMAEPAKEVVKTHNLDVRKLVLLVPGGSAHRPEKRWSHFSTLATELLTDGYHVALIGAGAEQALLDNIAAETGVINLCNQTTIGQLVDLSSKCQRIIGNDTGPMHIAAASGATGVVLFGSASDPDLCAPRTDHTTILQKPDIDDLSVSEVRAAAGL